MDKSNSQIYLFNCDRPFHVYHAQQLRLKKGQATIIDASRQSYELLIMAAGHATVQSGQQWDLCKGTSLVVPLANSIAINSQSANCTIFQFQFRPKDDQQLLDNKQFQQQLASRHDFSQLINNVVIPVEYQMTIYHRVNSACFQIMRLIQISHYTDAIVSYAVTELMLMIANDFLTSMHHVIRSNPKAVAILKWLNENLDETLTVHKLADHFGMNYRYVSRLIKQETGMTASNWIIQKRLDIACDLLLRSNLPLKVIADRAYFSDEKYFLRIFKKRIGQTPTQYRQQYMDDFLLNDTKARQKQNRK